MEQSKWLYKFLRGWDANFNQCAMYYSSHSKDWVIKKYTASKIRSYWKIHLVAESTEQCSLMLIKPQESLKDERNIYQLPSRGRILEHYEYWFLETPWPMTGSQKRKSFSALSVVGKNCSGFSLSPFLHTSSSHRLMSMHNWRLDTV